MRWQDFEASAPDIAAFVREQLEQTRVAILGSLRKDGSPRISMIEPYIVDGDIYLGMMWRSRKALDLLRDPRLALHNAICTSTGEEGEFSLRGRAIEIRDPALRSKYVQAVSERITWREQHFHLFSVDIETASLIQYEGGEEQSVKVWPQGTEFKRQYG